MALTMNEQIYWTIPFIEPIHHHLASICGLICFAYISQNEYQLTSMPSNISNPTSSGFNGSIKQGVEHCTLLIYCDILVHDTSISVCLSPNNLFELFPVLKIAKTQFPMESDIRSLNCKYFGWRFLCKLCRRMN